MSYTRDDYPIPAWHIPSRVPRKGHPTKVCPRCDGEGLVTVYIEQSAPWRLKEVDAECPECDGAGAIEVEDGQ